MNMIFRKKCRFLARLIGTLGTLGALCAIGSLQATTTCEAMVERGSQQQDNTFSLREAHLQLKELKKDIKDKGLAERVHDAYKKSGEVVKAGSKADPEKVKMALSAVQKVLGVLEQNKMKERHHSSSSQNSASCSICSELSNIDSEIESCCRSIHEQLEEIIRFLEYKFPCDAPIGIKNSSLPLTINRSGKYCVKDDLLWNGNAGTSAITVLANNVTINFEGHSLTVFNDGANGISVLGNEFVLENDVIVGPSDNTLANTGAGVLLIGVQKATLNNIYVQNFLNGVEIDPSLTASSMDITIQNSFFQGQANAGAGVYVNDANGVTIDTCTFDGQSFGYGSTGLWILNGSQNVLTKDSTFTGWDYGVYCGNDAATTVVTYPQVSTITIEDCLVVGADDPNFFILVTLGDGLGAANDVIIRNSIFSQPNDSSTVGADGLLFQNGEGLLLENVVVDTITSFSETFNYQGAAIHIGNSNGGLAYHSILAKNVTVQGDNQDGLYIELGYDMTFDSCQFTDATDSNILIGANAFNVVVQNSMIGNGGGDGIDIYGVGNTIKDCTITGNGDDGIYLGNPPIDPTAVIFSGNTVDHCILSFNGLDTGYAGIDDAGGGNLIINCEANNNAYGFAFDVASNYTQMNGNTANFNAFGIYNAAATLLEIGRGGNAFFNNNACNNIEVDCVNVDTPVFPGSTTYYVGSNICCLGD